MLNQRGVTLPTGQGEEFANFRNDPIDLGLWTSHGNGSDAGLEQLEIVNRGADGAVFLRDSLALLGHAEIALNGTRRESIEKPVGRSRATADRASAAMKEANFESLFSPGCRDGVLRLMQGPLARENSAVLVAVAVADHHLLNGQACGRRLLAGEAPARQRIF